MCSSVFADDEFSDVQFRSFAQLVVHAAEMMQQPRRHGDVSLEAEAKFTDFLRGAVNLPDYGPDPNLLPLLSDAWQQLERSGVL